LDFFFLINWNDSENKGHQNTKRKGKGTRIKVLDDGGLGANWFQHNGLGWKYLQPEGYYLRESKSYYSRSSKHSYEQSSLECMERVFRRDSE
jgi:hypothetical protein